MTTRHQIMCVNKTNRMDAHHRIANVGGIQNGERWKITEDDAIKGIENGKWEFYVSVKGFTANVIIATHSGKKYLKTVNDGVHPDNLLSLPECP